MQSRVVDKRDGQTFGHSQRVGELCEGVARLLRLPDEECNTIRVGGILHDLGKIAIPDSILLKPGKLTPEEYEIIKTHPVEGAQILAEHPEQKDVSEIVMHHHERWDGAGYPDGLRAEAIPLGSRIVNACDAFDTITQARVFRPTVKTPAEAIRELRQLAMILADIARALLTVTIPFLAVNWLPGVFIAVALVATASTFFNPAKQALIPNLVPPKLLVKANGLVVSSERAMELLGYSVA